MQDNQQENCPSCPKVFNDKSKLKAHERQVHQANPVPCEVCGELQFNKYTQVINSLGRGNFLGPISDYVWGLLYVRDERFLIK